MTLILSGTDGLSDIDGSAATPAIRGTDANTGIFFPAADTAAIATGGTERVRVDSSGNVGIGTSSPSTYVANGGLALFNNYGTSSTALAISNNSGFSASNIARIDFRVNNSFGGNERIAAIWGINPNAGSNNGGALVFGVSANGTATTPSEVARIDSSGNFQFNSGYGSVATAYGCRAWVNFNGTGVVAIRASGNVTSITDNGTGDYTVNFTTAMPDANYNAVVGVSTSTGTTTVAYVASNGSGTIVAPTSSALRIASLRRSDAVATDVEYYMVSIFR